MVDKNRDKGRRGAVLRETLLVPPQSVESEQAVLGGLMLSPDSLDIVVDILVEADFYRRDHRLIFRSIKELAEKAKPFDAVTMGEWFEANNLTEQMGGSGYLIELASTTPSAANIKAYAQIVREKASLRALIDAGTETVNDGFRPEGRDANEIIAAAEQRIFSVAATGRLQSSQYVTPREGMKRVFEALQERYENEGALIGLPTGLADLDEMTAGLQDTDLIIIAARPAMGKSSMALQIAEYVATLQGKSRAVGVYSMEMSADQLYARMLSSRGRIDAQRFRTGRIEDADWGRINMAIKELSTARLFIDESPALSPDVLRAKARRLKREQDIGLIVVDYLQLMQVPGNEENRANEVAYISRSLKALAKELKIPVVALSQLNRSLESRTDKRPVMADLRESGAIEQDADVIVFLYRDEYYNKESPDKGIAEIIIAKQRSGPTGMVKARWNASCTRFDNLSREPGF